MLENVDLNELLSVLGGLGVSVVLLGLLISRYTETPKDDAFFAKLAKALGIKKSD